METYTITQEQLDSTPQENHHWKFPGVTGPGQYIFDESQNSYRPVTASPAATGYDFDGGFGIGGLGRHVEKPIIPSVEAIERVERMEQRATYCKRCGQSDVFDGAMFTTDASSGLCDDCY